MPCDDPRCELAGGGEFYCRTCGVMTHAECACDCRRAEVTCPECGHQLVVDVDAPEPVTGGL